MSLYTLHQNLRVVTAEKGVSAPLDILVKEGVIAEIGPGIQAPTPETVVHQHNGAFASIPWLDLGVYVCDPGYEHREDVYSAAAAAAAGGFGALVTMPNTLPAVHSKSEITYLKSKSAGLPVAFYPLGAISNDCAGKDIAELYDMHTAGAVAFTDGASAIQDAGLLLRAMQYVTAFNGLVINRPHHKTIASGGQMHEGIVSTSLGLKGIPALSEHLMVQRDLSLLEYAGPAARLHLHLVSTAKSVDMIRAAKAAGLNVTASVALANLCYTDQALAMEEGASPFDTSLKTMPPLRSCPDAEALIAGVNDGTIDFICTNHTPWDEEAKNLEFPYAEFGMTGLETAYPMYNMFLAQHIPIERFVDAIAVQPRQLLGLPVPALETGAPARFTIFHPETAWTLTTGQVQSKSLNTPLLGKMLQGRAYLVG
jgi:dihydroorotase